MMGDGGFPRWIRPSPPWMAPAAHLARRWPWLRQHLALAEQGGHAGGLGSRRPSRGPRGLPRQSQWRDPVLLRRGRRARVDGGGGDTSVLV